MQIHPISFFVSLAIGLFIVYISTPVPEVIIMYPTPQNVENVTYQDINQVCYRYKMDQSPDFQPLRITRALRLSDFPSHDTKI